LAVKRKTCPECGGRSYSSGADRWVCPYCGEDLTGVQEDEWRASEDD